MGDNERRASGARGAALGGEKAVANGGKRGGACLIARGFSSSDAVRAT